MDPLTIGAIAAPILGGLFGNSASSASREQIMEAAKQAVANYQKIGVPSAQAMQLVLSHYKSAGLLTPEMEQTISQGSTNLADIKDDPSLKAAQSGALDSLQNIAKSGGMTLTDKANMENTIGQADNHATAVRGAIEQNFRDRGQMGSTGELLAQLQNQQSADTQAHDAGLSATAAAEARALSAIQAQGSLAGSVRAQDYGEASNAAGAQDAIDRYNAANRQSVANTNTGASNYGQQYNLQNQQSLSNQNTGLDNYQQQYNSNLQQQQFQNEMTRANGMAGALGGEESALAGQANQQAGMWTGMGQGVGQAFGAQANRDLVNSYLQSKGGTSSASSSPWALSLQGSGPTSWAGDDEQKNKQQQQQYA